MHLMSTLSAQSKSRASCKQKKPALVGPCYLTVGSRPPLAGKTHVRNAGAEQAEFFFFTCLQRIITMSTTPIVQKTLTGGKIEGTATVTPAAIEVRSGPRGDSDMLDSVAVL